MKDNLYAQLALLVVRHGLTALGLSGVVSGDEAQQIVGAVATGAGLLWSAYRKIQAARKMR